MPKILISNQYLFNYCSEQEVRSSEMSTKTLSLALFLFTALTLTHAALVDYRSGIESRAGNDSKLMANQLLYLQTRKLAGAELSHVVKANDRLGIWRGKTRSRWIENGLCCGVFELLVNMKGGRTRKTLLRLLLEPKNKLQMSHELDIDWKAVDGHVVKLLHYNLVSEIVTAGTCKLYAITLKGRRALELAEQWKEPDRIECT